MGNDGPGPFWEENRKFRELVGELNEFGMSDKDVAFKCDVTPCHVSFIKNGHRPTPKVLFGKLEALVDARRKYLGTKIFDLNRPTSQVVAYCHTPGTPLGRSTEGRVAVCLRRYLVTAILGETDTVRLPKGVSGVLVRVGPVYVVLVDDSVDAPTERRVAHELEALAREIRRKHGEDDGPDTPKELIF